MVERWVSWDSDDPVLFKTYIERARMLKLDGVSMSLFLPVPTMNQRIFPDDAYTQYTIHNASLFKYVEAGVFSGIYPAEVLEKNCFYAI